MALLSSVSPAVYAFPFAAFHRHRRNHPNHRRRHRHRWNERAVSLLYSVRDFVAESNRNIHFFTLRGESIILPLPHDSILVLNERPLVDKGRTERERNYRCQDPAVGIRCATSMSTDAPIGPFSNMFFCA